MNLEIQRLKERADQARIAYLQNFISREEARADIEPYIQAYNEKSKQIAKKHGVRPKSIHFVSYIR